MIIKTKKNTDMAKSDYMRVGDFPKNKENPFMPDLLDAMTVTRRRKQLSSSNGKHNMVVVDTDDKHVAHAAFYEIQEVDDAQFIKVFASFFAIQSGLTKSGREVLIYLMTIIKPREDKIIVRTDLALKFLGYATQKPLFKGIADLLEKEVIARSNYSEEYFINPMIMFNGDRVTFAKTFIRKKSTQKKEENPDQFSLFDEKNLIPHKTKNPSFDTATNLYRKENPHLSKFTEELKSDKSPNIDPESGEVLN